MNAHYGGESSGNSSNKNNKNNKNNKENNENNSRSNFENSADAFFLRNNFNRSDSISEEEPVPPKDGAEADTNMKRMRTIIDSPNREKIREGQRTGSRTKAYSSPNLDRMVNSRGGSIDSSSSSSSIDSFSSSKEKVYPPSPSLSFTRSSIARIVCISLTCLAIIIIICAWLGPSLNSSTKGGIKNLHITKFNDAPQTVMGLSGASFIVAQTVAGGGGVEGYVDRVVQTTDESRIFDVRIVAGAVTNSTDIRNGRRRRLLREDEKKGMKMMGRALSGGGGGTGKVKSGVLNVDVVYFSSPTSNAVSCLRSPLGYQLYSDGEVEHLETVKGSSFTDSGNCPSLGDASIGSFAFRATTTATIPVGISMEVVSLPGWASSRVVISGVLLLSVYVLIVLDVVHRTLVAMVGGMIALFILACMGEFRDIQEVVIFIDESTLALLFGMMIMVNLTSTTGLFEWTAIRALEFSGGDMRRLLITLCASTAVLSAFLDNVTTMLLLAPVTMEICKLIDVPPMPFLLSEVMFSNVGGTSTMIGDPPNIIIGSMLKDQVGFVDFIVNLMPVIIIASVPTMYFLVWYFRKDVDYGAIRTFDSVLLRKQYPITNPNLLLESSIIMGSVILLFFLEPVHHVSTSWIAIIGAILMMLIATPHSLHSVFENVEWDTLLFFAALFVMIEALAEMGLITWIGDVLANIIRGAPKDSQIYVAISVILLASALVSGFLDNIPYTTTMVPVIRQLAADPDLSLSIGPLIWSLSLGACLGGNMTLVGASANLVTAGAAEHVGHKIGFLQFMKLGSCVVAITVSIALAWCLVIYGAAGWDGKISGGDSNSNYTN